MGSSNVGWSPWTKLYVFAHAIVHRPQSAPIH